MTGVDWPGKSATQSASLVTSLSGRSFSSDTPVCSGPRAESQPRAGAAFVERDVRRMAPARTAPVRNKAVSTFITRKNGRDSKKQSFEFVAGLGPADFAIFSSLAGNATKIIRV